jgi:predicted nuclease of predicted toxin-antitoxin system
MLFFVDANLPRSATALLIGLGHQVEFARDAGLGAATDAEIAAHVQKTRAALLTRDLDFGDIRRYPPKDYYGIVVLRLPDDMIAEDIVQVLERFLREPVFVERLRGRLAIVEPHRVRFRPPLN